MHLTTKKTLAWGVATVAALSMASVNLAAANNLAQCPAAEGCLFRDANYWNLHASGWGGYGPWNIPVEVNDSSSSYANKSSWKMTLYTNSNSGGQCGAYSANSMGNLYSPFQDSVSSWSLRAGGC